jgi:dephospho-CoA kinase
MNTLSFPVYMRASSVPPNSTMKTSFLKVAVTGGAGSGKSLVCARFKALGVEVLSADSLARKALETGNPCHEKAVAAFGSRILNGGGEIDRSILREIIFQNENARKTLERIVHPEVEKLIAARLREAERSGEPVLLVEVPLLFEAKLEKMFDLVILVNAGRTLQVQRLIERDSVTRRQAEALLSAQLPNAVKIDRADIVIQNDGAIADLMRSVDRVFFDLGISIHPKALDSQSILL